MNDSQKYCRSLHAQISKGTTSDDRFMSDGYVDVFSKMPQHILSEKLDGQNDCFSRYGLFARSHAASSQLPWDKPMLQRWELIKNDLGDLEIFGENMYGVHTIAYKKLESYFYVFAVREKDQWLSWEEVKFYAELYDFPTVPTIELKFPLSNFIKDNINENICLNNWLTANLGMSWEDSVNTPGLLGGYDTITGKDASEGFVIRNTDGFKTNSGTIKTDWNEFNNLMKIVREGHVKTDEHWTKNWKPSTLIDYTKYNWHSYEFLNQK